MHRGGISFRHPWHARALIEEMEAPLQAGYSKSRFQIPASPLSAIWKHIIIDEAVGEEKLYIYSWWEKILCMQ